VNWFPASVDIPFNGHLAKHFNLADYTTYMEQFFSESTTFFFFLKSIEYIKSAEGRNPWYTRSIQRGLRGREEIREKIRKTNHLWGQPPLSPSESTTFIVNILNQKRRNKHETNKRLFSFLEKFVFQVPSATLDIYLVDVWLTVDVWMHQLHLASILDKFMNLWLHIVP
jgi:hypothetical protein